MRLWNARSHEASASNMRKSREKQKYRGVMGVNSHLDEQGMIAWTKDHARSTSHPFSKQTKQQPKSNNLQTSSPIQGHLAAPTKK